MVVEIYIEKNLGRNWIEKGNIFFTGGLFHENTLLTDGQAYDCLSKVTTFDDCKMLLKKLNGFFSFIIKTQDRVFVAVDRVRSIPLFYATKGNILFISNDAEAVRKITNNVEFDPIAVQEFTARMVCGSDTLFSDVKQVQPGDCIEFELSNANGINITAFKYFIFTHSEKYDEQDRPQLEGQMLSVFSECIDRLVDYAKGRQLILPLSAGYDSRLIALMLYKKGIKNVLCFSYGMKENFEAKISKQVADILGFKWEFIEYTDDLWREWCHTNEYLKYLRVANGWSSLPHAQDWPAVWELKKRKKVDNNAVFIPGHVGDCLAGNDVPFDSIAKCKADMSHFFYDLFIGRYNNLQNLPKEILPNKINNKWRIFKNRVSKMLAVTSISSAAEYADAYEKWNWQESNPKFIINSVRVYEFWGYDWYLPFVDNDFMEYWKDVPLCLRVAKKMYNETVDKFFFELTGMQPPHHRESCAPVAIPKFIKDIIRYTWLHSIYLKYLFTIKKSSFEKNDTNFPRGKYNAEIFEDYSHYRGGLNFLEAVQFFHAVPDIMKLKL